MTVKSHSVETHQTIEPTLKHGNGVAGDGAVGTVGAGKGDAGVGADCTGGAGGVASGAGGVGSGASVVTRLSTAPDSSVVLSTIADSPNNLMATAGQATSPASPLISPLRSPLSPTALNMTAAATEREKREMKKRRESKRTTLMLIIVISVFLAVEAPLTIIFVIEVGMGD